MRCQYDGLPFDYMQLETHSSFRFHAAQIPLAHHLLGSTSWVPCQSVGKTPFVIIIMAIALGIMFMNLAQKD